jgi:protein involved in sex pheromone biosynthesis
MKTFETLNIDSFDALQFIVALDEKLGIEIPEQDYGKTNTLKITSFPISRIKWTNKNPNLENRIIRNNSNHSFFGTKQKYHENNVQHIRI